MTPFLLALVLVAQVSGPPDPREAFGPRVPAVPVVAKPTVVVPAKPSDAWPVPSARVFAQPQGPLTPPQSNRVQITDLPVSPNDLYERAAVALTNPSLVEPSRRFETRFLTHWPVQSGEHAKLERALFFWMASLSNRRVFIPPERVPDLGWRVYLSDYDWTAEAWDSLAVKHPYFAVSMLDAAGLANRGWLEPQVEYALRTATQATIPIERADRFLGLTSIDVGDPRGGVYSKFLRLPNTEGQLFKQVGVDEKFLKDNDLLRGGAVLGGQSIVAQHNRELQLLPSPIGLDEGFLWRSLDTASDEGDQSVVKNFAGTIRINGGEYIGSLRNGLHYYYLVNQDKKQVRVVPPDIAQDKSDPHDTQVHTPYKCVKCHGPKGGIRHFDDVVARMALSPNVALGIIQKYENRYDDRIDNTTRLALEDYYLSPLAQDITQHQESYTRAIRGINGLTPTENVSNYLKFVEGYLFQLVDREQAAYELAVELEQLDAYLKQTGSEELMTILAAERIPRALFEDGFADGMKARIYPWERSPVYAVVQPQRPKPIAEPQPAKLPAAPAKATPAVVQPSRPSHPAPVVPHRSDDHPSPNIRWRMRR